MVSFNFTLAKVGDMIQEVGESEVMNMAFLCIVRPAYRLSSIVWVVIGYLQSTHENLHIGSIPKTCLHSRYI